jgi:hypothetical protein
MAPEEFRTIRITPASATKRKRFAQKREAELAQLHSDGWEIVDVEPERILRSGDKVTVRRERTVAEPEQADDIGLGSWWGSLDSRGRASVLVVLFAVLVLIFGVSGIL